MFKKPTEVWEEQMNALFDVKSHDETNKVIEALSIILNKDYSSKNTDLIDLFNYVGFDNFISVVTLFERRTVTFPSKDEIKEAVMLALIFYYRETKGYSWTEIKDTVPFDFSSISYSFKLKSLNKYIVSKLTDLFKEEPNKKDKKEDNNESR